MKKLLLLPLAYLLCGLHPGQLRGQQIPLNPLPLNNLSAFRPAASTWKIVGGIQMDRRGIEFSTQPGTGILLNEVREADHAEMEKLEKARNQAALDQYKLLTTWEHGDIELECEVMIPKGSNSGLYFMGRYELQLFDSWATTQPKFSDLGGIYRNWESEPGKIYPGKAPLTNAAKAPGTWQTLRVYFKAPRFAADGKKVANAEFVRVEINGVKIHDHVEVPLPTGGPVANNEQPTGPLMIQGDHGSIAFRNIKYRLIGAATASLTQLRYDYWEGNFKSISDFVGLPPKRSGALEQLTCEVAENPDRYGLRYQGTLEVPTAGRYYFNLFTTGGVVMEIDGKKIANAQYADGWYNQRVVFAELTAGTHPFSLYLFKDAGWLPPRLGLAVEGAAIQRTEFQTFGSAPPNPNPEPPVFVRAGAQPKLLRAFLDFKGEPRNRITHAIGVGQPQGPHYVYDLKAGSLACVWRGDFVDASPMWIDRGDGSFRPMGSPQYLYQGQSLAVLNSITDLFPLQYQEGGSFQPQGYRIGPADGQPVFRFKLAGAEFADRIIPTEEGRALQREIRLISGQLPGNLHCKLAEGTTIVPLADGSYQIDQQYYVVPSSGARVIVREFAGKKELVAPFTERFLGYALIW